MRFSLAFLLMCLLAPGAFGGRLADLNYDPLRPPGSAKLLGMGEAIPYSDFSPGDMWLTPTGVATVAATEVLLSSSEKFTASFSYPLGSERALGVGFATHTLTGVRMGTQEVGTRLQVANIAYRFPVEKWLGREKWVGGIGVRIPFATHLSIGSEVDRSASIAPSFDIGLRSLSSPGSEFTLGIQGILGRLAWGTGDADSSPLRSFLSVHSEYGNFTFVVRSFGGTTLHWGNSFEIQENLQLRAGIHQAGSASNMQTYISGGAGWQMRGLHLDAALAQTGEPGGYRLFLSARLSPYAAGPDSAHEEDGETVTRVPVSVVVFSPEELARALKIDEPADGLETTGETVVVRGRVHPNFQLSVNHLQASVGKDGSFALQLPLAIGENLVRFEASLKDQKVEEVRTIYRKSRLLLSEEIALRDKFYALPKDAHEEAEEITWKLKEIRNALETSYRLSAMGPQNPPGQKYITRRELALWLARTQQLPRRSLTIETLPDVSIEDPALSAILAVVDAKWMTLDNDRRFHPDRPVTVQEMKGPKYDF